MSKNYYRYCPAIFRKESYENNVIERKNYHNDYDFPYKNKYFFIKYVINDISPGIIDEYELKSYKYISYYCYEENGIFYDIITGEQLTVLNEGELIEENKIYFDINLIEKVNVSQVLNDIKLLSRKDIRKYKKYMNEEVKTKSLLEVKCNDAMQREFENKKKNKIESISEQKLQKKLTRMSKMK